MDSIERQAQGAHPSETTGVAIWETEVVSDIEEAEPKRQEFENWLQSNLTGKIVDEGNLEIFIGQAGTGFKEAMVNAITYGNLGWKDDDEIKKLKSEDKVVEAGLRQTKIQEWIKAHPDLAARKVKITCELHPNFLLVRIWDHDTDFTELKHPEKNPLDEDKLLDQTGRGILLIQHSYDENKINLVNGGKELVLKKYIEKPI